jgi:putative PIN family toxin of toxin-antitoxin system
VPVVFDSGVWISALKFGGLPYEAVRTAFALDRIACCAEIRIEVERIMSVKFGWLRDDTIIAMNGFLEHQADVQLRGTTRGICRDPNDDMVLECALVAGASFIVSGDRDLLVLKAFSGISIMTAREYLDQPGILALS